MKRIVLFFCLLCCFVSGQQSTGPATSKGSCTTANTGNHNIFKITCGIGEEQGKELLGLINAVLKKEVDLKILRQEIENLQSDVHVIRVSEEREGELLPASDPDPPVPESCPALPPNAFRIFLGTSVVFSLNDHPVNAVTLAGKPLLTLRKSASGKLLVDAKVLGRDGRAIVEIKDGIFVISATEAFRKQHPDPSTLVVYGPGGLDDLVLSVRFNNPHTATVLGKFFLEGRYLEINKNEIRASRVVVSGTCSASPNFYVGN